MTRTWEIVIWVLMAQGAVQGLWLYRVDCAYRDLVEQLQRRVKALEDKPWTRRSA